MELLRSAPLVNEKFLALCRDFGAENVGMATGDATVNRDALILCCTAEILANYALRDGAATWISVNFPISSGCFSRRRSTALARSRIPFV